MTGLRGVGSTPRLELSKVQCIAGHLLRRSYSRELSVVACYDIQPWHIEDELFALGRGSPPTPNPNTFPHDLQCMQADLLSAPQE